MNINLIVILGPTASGKTGLATRLAGALGGEIISADSRQVYRGMDIGTGKDLSEYRIDAKAIPYHLIDIVDPDSDFSVFDFQRRFFGCFSQITSRGVMPILVGGAGLYLESVIRTYRMHTVGENQALREEMAQTPTESLVERLLALNPGVHNKSDFKDRARLMRAIEIAEYSRNACITPDSPAIDALVIGIRWERSVLRERITIRLKKRLAAGLIEEVRMLHASGVSWERLNYFGLEYRYVALYLQGKLDEQSMLATLNTRIHQFAKRQETWFRRMERSGTVIRWIDGDDYDMLMKIVHENIMHKAPG